MIVGIDPGTTFAYSVIDFKGKIVKIKSIRQHDINTLIKEISEFKPLIITCDKKNAPSTVAKIAIKVGAKLMLPKYDILVKEKHEIIKKYSGNFSNDHERDSLASAFFAYHKLENVLSKIEKQVDTNIDSVRKLVIKKDLPIKLAIDILTSTKEEDKIIKKVIEQGIDEKFLKLITKLKEKDEKIKNLYFEIKSLKDSTKKLKNKKNLRTLELENTIINLRKNSYKKRFDKLESVLRKSKNKDIIIVEKNKNVKALYVGSDYLIVDKKDIKNKINFENILDEYKKKRIKDLST